MEQVAELKEVKKQKEKVEEVILKQHMISLLVINMHHLELINSGNYNSSLT